MDRKELLSQNIQGKALKDKIQIQPHNKILFIGDSITDVGRQRADTLDLGTGFPLLVAAQLQAKYPHYDLTILNRGIGGDQLHDLKNRWEEDCLDLTPDIVTILIGINDVWFAIDERKEPTAAELEKFEEDYRYLLKTLAHRTDARVVLMEPFVLPYPKDRQNWRKHLDPRIQIVRRLADDYHAVLVPLDGILNAKGIVTDHQIYTGDDGVHPTLTGHAVIADAWFEYLDV